MKVQSTFTLSLVCHNPLCYGTLGLLDQPRFSSLFCLVGSGFPLSPLPTSVQVPFSGLWHLELSPPAIHGDGRDLPPHSQRPCWGTSSEGDVLPARQPSLSGLGRFLLPLPQVWGSRASEDAGSLTQFWGCGLWMCACFLLHLSRNRPWRGRCQLSYSL